MESKYSDPPIPSVPGVKYVEVKFLGLVYFNIRKETHGDTQRSLRAVIFHTQGNLALKPGSVSFSCPLLLSRPLCLSFLRERIYTTSANWKGSRYHKQPTATHSA